MPDHDNSLLPAWAADALRDEPTPRAESRERIMNRIREMPAPRTLAPPIRPTRWLRRGLLSPVGSAAATFLLVGFAVARLGSGSLLGMSFEQSARVVGDTIVQRVAAGAPGTLRDTLLDTLRIVEFVVRGPSVRSAAVMGEFNGWRATAMQRATDSEEWRARITVPRDALRFAYLVNDEHVPATPLPPARARTSPDSI